MTEVRNNFLVDFPEHEEFLKPFLFGFDVSYAEQKRLNNTIIFAYLLKPENHMREAFGIDKELLLAYSPYNELQPRAIQAVNMLFNVFPFKNRIDTLNCFVISKDEAILSYAGINSFSEEQTRSLVPFVHDELVANANDT